MKSMKVGAVCFLWVFFEVLPLILAAGYNETCSSEISCDESLYLICGDEDRCDCEETSLYIDSVAGCRLKANNFCEIPESGNVTQECVPYSECKLEDGEGESEYKCWCKSKISETLPSGSCPKMSYGETCTEDEEAPCDTTKFLKCNPSQKVCECRNGNEAKFDENDKVCKLLAGASCVNDAGSEKCVDRSLCFKGVCECDVPTFEMNFERECTVPYGGTCNSEKPCHTNSYQGCQSGICSCSNAENTYFDLKNKTCFLLHNATCSPGNQMCAPNSFCDEDISKTCQCSSEDLNPNEIRRCALGYNGRCDVNDNLCDEFKYLECNSTTARCDCKLSSESFFDPISGKCQHLANAPCTPTPESQKCIEDATCESSDDANFPFQCKCIGSQEPNKNRKCFLPYNATCDNLIRDKCDPAAFLSCHTDDHKCRCERMDMEYVNNEKSCRILPGGPCSVIGDNNPLCGKNSFCNGDNCTCNPGFESTGRATCLRMYGQRCSTIVPDCNTYKNIKCVNGTCGCESGDVPANSVNGTQCYSGYKHLCSQELSCYTQGFLTCTAGMCDCLSPSEQKFHTVQQKCLSLPGRRCNLNAAPVDIALHCVPHATCVSNQDISYGTCVCMEGYEPNLSEDQCVTSAADIICSHFSILSFILLFIISHF